MERVRNIKNSVVDEAEYVESSLEEAGRERARAARRMLGVELLGTRWGGAALASIERGRD